MLLWTTGNAPFLYFQMIMMVLWFINIAKIVTCGLWINVNSWLFIFFHWNPCIAGKHRRPFYWPRTTGNQNFLLHIWLMVGPKFQLSWIERICWLIITTSPTDLNKHEIIDNNPQDKQSRGLKLGESWSPTRFKPWDESQPNMQDFLRNYCMLTHS